MQSAADTAQQRLSVAAQITAPRAEPEHAEHLAALIGGSAAGNERSRLSEPHSKPHRRIARSQHRLRTTDRTATHARENAARPSTRPPTRRTARAVCAAAFADSPTTHWFRILAGMNLRIVAAAAVTLIAAVGCIPGGEEEQADAAPAYATTIPDQTADLIAGLQADGAVSVGEWRCGEVKEALYRAIATLETFAGTLDPDNAETLTETDIAAPENDDSETPLWTYDTLDEALAAAGHGLNTADQAALNAACELYGQHDSALELWATGERGDACDVWRPAHAAAAEADHSLDGLHPISARMWVSATGAVAEGHGRCIAERAN